MSARVAQREHPGKPRTTSERRAKRTPSNVGRRTFPKTPVDQFKATCVFRGFFGGRPAILSLQLLILGKVAIGALSLVKPRPLAVRAAISHTTHPALR
jgi:hypothetical protein